MEVPSYLGFMASLELKRCNEVQLLEAFESDIFSLGNHRDKGGVEPLRRPYEEGNTDRVEALRGWEDKDGGVEDIELGDGVEPLRRPYEGKKYRAVNEKAWKKYQGRK